MALQEPALIHSRRSGFSLLEMAVVVAIISVVVALGVNLGSNAVRGADRMSTQEKLATIQKALDFYAQRTGYLPCPANILETPRANPTTFGAEARTIPTGCVTSGTGASGGMVLTSGATDCTTPSVNSGAYIGMVPVRAIGLPDSYAVDAWDNKIRYAVSRCLTSDPAAYSSYPGSITVRSGARTGTNYAITNLQDDTNTPGAGASYVVISHGPEGRGGIALNATAWTLNCGSTTLNDVENCNGDATFYDNDYTEGGRADLRFEDFVVWGSNAMARSTAPTTPAPPSGCSSGCYYWCAPCSNSPPFAGARVCEKTITSNSPCRAYCTYAGKNGMVWTSCP